MIGRVTAVGVLLAALASASALAGPSPCSVHYPSDARVAWRCQRVGKGETLETLFGPRWMDVARFNRIDRRHAYPGIAIKIPERVEDIERFNPLPSRYEPGASVAKLVLIDLSEQFLGAYELGSLVFSAPIASGRARNPTPAGTFRISAVDRDHRSSRYFIEGTSRPYPMRFGLRFHVTRGGVTYWIHGRDLPGFPASHGCIGLYDEAMQQRYYGTPRDPVLADARRLYTWVVGDLPDFGGPQPFDGPRVDIVGAAPVPAVATQTPRRR